MKRPAAAAQAAPADPDDRESEVPEDGAEDEGAEYPEHEGGEDAEVEGATGGTPPLKRAKSNHALGAA
eukprot:1447772-Pyramimonas_sp.AAC.1